MINISFNLAFPYTNNRLVADTFLSMNEKLKSPLVTTDWLSKNIHNPLLRVVDASWYLPAMERNGHLEYKEAHIPGAFFWDIDMIAARDTSLPHMLPTPEDFQKHMDHLGIENETTVIVYDGFGLFTAARPWWMLRIFGHEKVFVLDGGLPKWKAEERKIETAEPSSLKTQFKASFNEKLVRTTNDIIENLESKNEQILDARPAGRFFAEEPEPRTNCRSGHIPGALNLPFDQLLDPTTKTVLSNKFLEDKFYEAGINLNKPVITSCGSGVTACVLAFALYLLDKRDVGVYDGSWSEWGTNESLPIETD